MIARRWQQFEGGLVFAAGLAVYLYSGVDLPWWLALLIFFSPDISFLAYLAGPKAGAVAYNSLHVYGFGAVLFALGSLTAIPVLAGIGLLILAHSGFDRMLGYGLKSDTDFQLTHLGRIGKAK
jgi:hypothetical protein